MIPILQGKKLSALMALDVPLQGEEIMYLVTPSGQPRKVTTAQFADLVESLGGGALQAAQNLADVPNKSLARQNLGLKSMALQDASLVAITGGTINNTPIGNINPAYGRFSELIVTTSITLPAGSITIGTIAGNIPNSKLENSSINLNLEDGLAGDTTVSLGGTLNLRIDFVDGGDF